MSLNRQQRRKLAKQNKSIKQPAYRGMTHEQKLERIFQQGISLEDLKREYQYGYEDGHAAASPTTFKTCYAAAILALHELLGFGRKRCQRVLRRMDEMVMEYLGSQEIIDAVWDKIGLKLDFNEPLDRIQETDEHHPWRRRAHDEQTRIAGREDGQ